MIGGCSILFVQFCKIKIRCSDSNSFSFLLLSKSNQKHLPFKMCAVSKKCKFGYLIFFNETIHQSNAKNGRNVFTLSNTAVKYPDSFLSNIKYFPLAGGKGTSLTNNNILLLSSTRVPKSTKERITVFSSLRFFFIRNDNIFIKYTFSPFRISIQRDQSINYNYANRVNSNTKYKLFVLSVYGLIHE